MDLSWEVAIPAASFINSAELGGLCLPRSLAFDPNDLFIAIPLRAVIWSNYCSVFPLCCSCCQLGKQVRQEDAPSPP